MPSPGWAQTVPPTQDQSGQTTQSQSRSQAEQQPTLSVDLDRIRQAVQQPSIFAVEDTGLHFRVEVVGRVPSFDDFIGGFNLRSGPVPRAAMTHAEYLSQVTPKELYGSGGITASELLQANLMNAALWAGIKGIRSLVDEYREASTERERQRIRDQIERELAALRGEKIKK